MLIVAFSFVLLTLCVQRLSHAHEKSDVISRRDGTVVTRSDDARKSRKIESQTKEKASQKPRQHRQGVQTLAGNKLSQNSDTLCVKGLPLTTTADMMTVLFENFPGFQEASISQERKGSASVKFETHEHAAVALNGLQGFRLNPTHTLTLSYMSLDCT